MNIEEILKFKAKIAKYNIEELEKEQSQLRLQITKMIMDSDVTTKIALIEAKLKERKGK